MESAKIMKEEEFDNFTTKLPFDQFSRQRIVSYLIDKSFRKIFKNKKFKIIDIGGYGGKTTEFQPNDNVTILDVFDKKYKNYIKGEATETDFSNNFFDIACSFDVLEHIPREKRESFINESLRISKIGVFLCVPVDIDGVVSGAEVLLNNFYKNIYETDHKWLKEHIENRIPSEEDIIRLVKTNEAFQTSISSNQIGDWQLMQMLLFASSKIPDIVGEVNDINTWYNRNTMLLDSRVSIGYRKIFFISKNKNNVVRVADIIEKLEENSKHNKQISINEKTFNEFSNTLSLITKKYSSLVDKYMSVNMMSTRKLVEKIKELNNKLDDSRKYNLTLKREISLIQNSFAWRILKPLMTSRKNKIKNK
jgi:hypothetical protein